MNKIDLIIEAIRLAEYHVKAKGWGDDVDLELYTDALAAAREIKELKWREAFICGRCDGVYADMCVSECDCEVGVEPIFKRGFICYALDEVTK